jgi:hypothetical protein
MAALASAQGSLWTHKFIIISDAETALQMLRDRANVHSGRPAMMFGGEMIGWKNTLAMQQPDETFKLYRKNMAKVASSAAILSVFDRVQEEESVRFLSNMLESPDKLFNHIRMEAGAVILRITYGYTPKSNGKDPLVDLVGQAMANFADATTPGKYAVDVLPFCKLQNLRNTYRTNGHDLSETHSGVVARHRLQSKSSSFGTASGPHCRRTLCIC